MSNSSNLSRARADETDVCTHEDMLRRTEELLPLIRREALAAEQAERISPAVMEAMEEAGLFEIVVPEVYGGHGLGLDTLMQVTRLIARADVSVSWIASFLIQHNLWICRLPPAVQKQLYRDRTNVKLAASQGYDTSVVEIEDGYRVSGRFPYCSGIMQASHCLLPGIIERESGPEVLMLLASVDDVEILDDWKMSGMRSTESRTVVAKDVFVSKDWAVPAPSFWAAQEVGSAFHKAAIFRAPLMKATMLNMTSYCLGAAEECVRLGREKLPGSRTFGVARIDRALSRVRWSEAHQATRAAACLYEHAMGWLVAKIERADPWTDEEMGQLELDILAIVHMCKDAIRKIVDGSGSSAFARSNPLQRFMRDVDMLSTHALSSDYDIIADRGARQMLGLGRTAEDPPLFN